MIAEESKNNNTFDEFSSADKHRRLPIRLSIVPNHNNQKRFSQKNKEGIAVEVNVELSSGAMIDGVKLAGAPVVMGQSWSTDSEEARSSLLSAKGGTVAEFSGSVVVQWWSSITSHLGHV
ncbi:hypothetical protein RDI58_001682 [Solanum bulbocastanum]|uniref:Uncharacterized protein n=1 Tax=Solanum bulbocastanum TaxID=147425 RepID=A0AAN8UA06_SOLBU